MTATRRSPVARLLPGLAALLLVVAACGASVTGSIPPEGTGGGASSQPGTTTPGPVRLTPVPGGATPDPGTTSGGGSGGGGGSGSAPGNPGDPGNPIPVGPGASGGTGPDPAQPSIVTPVAGLAGIHAVSASNLLASVDGHHVTIRVAWWSGVAPCSVLAGVDVARDGSTFTLTVREGSGQQSVACIEIARYKGAFVDLGELDPGTYTIRATGDVPAIEVDVKG